MSKLAQVVVLVAVAAAAFVIGVKSSEQVKTHASWMFESKDEEVALPDLSNEEIDGAGATEEVKVEAEAPAAESTEAAKPAATK